ncbi:MAG: BFD-like (2Fe-2S)-binding region [Proteobacteria bacterium]|nr:BFD-like (2Fe-2S)-binding region [Pseudomonadota bacterium]
MYVCVCMAVTERQIHEAARAGATTLKDLRRELGVSSECGQCAAQARKCLAAATEAGGQRPNSAPAAPQCRIFMALT